MALFNHFESEKNKQSKLCLDELKKHIMEKDVNGNLSEWYPALSLINDMEEQIKEQEAMLVRYQHFFNMMGQLLPPQQTPNTIIG